MPEANSEHPQKTYARFHVRLLSLIRTGHGDTETADDLRDQMDYPWNERETLREAKRKPGFVRGNGVTAPLGEKGSE